MKFLEITLDEGTILYLAIDSIAGVDIDQANFRATIFLKEDNAKNIVLTNKENIKTLQDKISRISF